MRKKLMLYRYNSVYQGHLLSKLLILCTYLSHHVRHHDGDHRHAHGNDGIGDREYSFQYLQHDGDDGVYDEETLRYLYRGSYDGDKHAYAPSGEDLRDLREKESLIVFIIYSLK